LLLNWSNLCFRQLKANDASASIPKKVPNSGIIIVKNASTMDQKCLFYQNVIFKTLVITTKNTEGQGKNSIKSL